MILLTINQWWCALHKKSALEWDLVLDVYDAEGQRIAQSASTGEQHYDEAGEPIVEQVEEASDWGEADVSPKADEADVPPKPPAKAEKPPPAPAGYRPPGSAKASPLTAASIFTSAADPVNPFTPSTANWASTRPSSTGRWMFTDDSWTLSRISPST